MKGQQQSMSLMVLKPYTPNPEIEILVDLGRETVWLTQKQIATILDLDVSTVNRGIKRIKKEREGGAESVIAYIAITASDGKSYQVEHYDFTVINLVGARAHHSESVQVFQDWVGQVLNREIVKQFLRTGTPINDPERTLARAKGKVSRNLLMEVIKEILDPPKRVYGEVTNDVYRGVFGRDSKVLKRELNTKKSPREEMDTVALSYLMIAETLCKRHIGDQEELTIRKAREVVIRISGMIGNQVTSLEQQLGIDVVTGRKLVGPRDAIAGI